MKTKIFLKHAFYLMLFANLLMTTGCTKDDPLSDLTGLTTFGFTNDVIKDYPFEVDNINYVIQNKDSLPYKFDASNLIAKFDLIKGSKVTVNGVSQTSGVTANNFTTDLQFVVTAEDKVTKKTYTVKVNVAKTNPEAVSWNQNSPNAFDSKYETQEYFYLNNKHWVIVGKKFQWFASNPETKLYSSTDGKSWKSETPTGDFPVGYNHNIVVKNNKAYVVGYVSGVDTYGAAQPTLEKNLFTTTDGLNWTKVSNALDIARILAPAKVLNNNIYVVGGNLQSGFGGFDGSKNAGAIFYPAAAISETSLISTDGSTFTASATYTANMPRRTYAASYVYNNKMYVAGGLDAQGYPLNDVWSSTDGVNWTLVSTGKFAARLKSSTVVVDNKVWMFGGQLADGTCTSEMLVSTDGGATWAAAEQFQKLPTNFTPRCNADVTVDANGRIWIVGGESTSVSGGTITTTILTDVWSGKLNKL